MVNAPASAAETTSDALHCRPPGLLPTTRESRDPSAPASRRAGTRGPSVVSSARYCSTRSALQRLDELDEPAAIVRVAARGRVDEVERRRGEHRSEQHRRHVQFVEKLRQPKVQIGERARSHPGVPPAGKDLPGARREHLQAQASEAWSCGCAPGIERRRDDIAGAKPEQLARREKCRDPCGLVRHGPRQQRLALCAEADDLRRRRARRPMIGPCSTACGRFESPPRWHPGLDPTATSAARARWCR